MTATGSKRAVVGIGLRGPVSRTELSVESVTAQSVVSIENKGSVRYITLNRPEKRNAINDAIVSALGEAFTDAASDSSVHCVVLRGEGPMFSSGMDLGLLVGLIDSPENLRPFRKGAISVWNLLEEMPKPTIAQIHGACIGGAVELVLACDMRVSSEDAVIGILETKVGLIPDVGGSSRLPSIVGLGRAKELIMTGKMINGVEAERIGLVNRVAPADQLEATTDALIAELAQCAPLAVGLSKHVMDASAKPALAATLEHEVTAQQFLLGSDDAAEGLTAAQEKRPPVYRGS